MNRAWQSRLFAWLVASSFVVAPPAADAQPTLLEGFEGPDTSWRVDSADATYELELHQRVQSGATEGGWCEELRLRAGHGTRVLIAHDVGQLLVIDEQRLTVWVRSDRAGLQVLARVVLPRSLDPQTGGPATAVIAGESYTDVGHWQRLAIEKTPRLVARQAWYLRGERRLDVDLGEAYVDRLLLNVYGGAGSTRVQIDDLEVAGVVRRLPDPSADESGDRGETFASTETAAILSGGVQSPKVAVEGSILMVEGRPTFVRMIESHGEPLALFARLGFNAVRFAVAPDGPTLAQARELGLWVVCPPPEEFADAERASQPWIGAEYDAVLAWDLGERLTRADAGRTKDLAAAIRRADAKLARPIVCNPDEDRRAYSRHADILTTGRSPIGTSLELADYATWLRTRSQFARPGTPFWTCIPVDADAAIADQASLFGGGRRFDLAAECEQIRLVAYTALAAGSRGLWFQPTSRIDGDDPRSLDLALTLELLNLELSLVEPWTAAGNFVSTISSRTPDVIGFVIQAERGRLVVPIWFGRHAQCVPGQSAGNGISLVVPGVPEAHVAYEVTPAGVHQLRAIRVTGGMQVTWEEFGLASLAVLTQDPIVLGSLSQRVARIEKRAADIERELAGRKLDRARALDERIALRTRPHPRAATWLASAEKSLVDCDRLLASGDWERAYREAHRAARPIRLLERAYWEPSLGPGGTPVTTPLAGRIAALPDQLALIDRLKLTRFGPSATPEASFEDLDRLIAAGWKHLQYAQPGVATRAEIVEGTAHGGRMALLLSASAIDDDNPPGLIESPPLWLTSPSIAVDEGEWVRIRGWINVPSPIQGSVDRLMIVDSLGGAALAERFDQTDGWRSFTLYRAAPAAGEVSVSFVLTGLGEAWIDDVSIERVVAPPVALR